MNNKEYTVSEVIDSFGMNKHTWLMFMLLALAMILDGYDFMVVNSTNMFVAHTFWPDNPNPGALMGSLTTWGLLGMVIGGAIGGIPLVYGIVLFFLMKETPHWYANAGRFDDAVKVLADIERVSLGTETKRDPSCLVVPPRPKKTTPSVLFSSKYIIGTCAIWSLYFVGQFCVYGMNAWLPAWFSGIGYSPSEAVALRPLSCSEASRAWRHSKPIGGTTNWSLVVLVLIVPFVLGFICALLFVRDTNGKSMDQLANEATGDELSGTAPFAIMLAIVVILFSLCIVCPLAISGWSKLPIALPLMATGMLLPFAFFFIFGGKQLAKNAGKK